MIRRDTGWFGRPRRIVWLDERQGTKASNLWRAEPAQQAVRPWAATVPHMEQAEATCSVGFKCYTCEATTGLRVVTSGTDMNQVCWTACETCATTRRTLRVEPRAALWMLQEHRKHRGLPVSTTPPPPAPRPLRLPDVFQDPGLAVAMVQTYFDGHRGSEPRYTGALFNSFAGGGDRPAVADHFTPDDLLAVSLLSVNVSARASIQILGDRASLLTSLLKEIPTDLDLADADDDHIGDRSPATHLWNELRRLDRCGPVTTSKLLARKRPRLIPIRDKVVLQELDHPGVGFWRDLRATLRENDGELAVHLAKIGERADLDHDVSVIRIFDVLVWMTGKRFRPHGWSLADEASSV